MMNRLLIKAAKLTCALLSILISSSFGFAGAFSQDQHKTDRLDQKQGCMMCHQGESMRSDDTPEQ